MNWQPERRSIAAPWPHAAMLALVVLVSAIGMPGASAQSPDLSSPRATFDTFLSSMVAVKQGDRSRLADAVSCLELSHLSSLVRREAGPRLAADLKNYLDKLERIDVGALPDAVEGDSWRYPGRAQVSLTRGADELWRFSSTTLDALPRLLESVRGRDFIAGIEGGGGAQLTLAGSIRNRVPDSLRRTVLFLELWQWVALILVIFVGVIIDRVVRLFLSIWLRKLLKSSDKLRDRKTLADFQKPVGILAMGVVWLLALPPLDLPLRALGALKVAAHLVVAIAGVWAAYRLVDLLAAHLLAMAKRTVSRVDDILIPLARRALKLVVIAFGVLFVAQNLDVDVTSLLAGLGIGGLAFALAAKDTVENLFGSVTVLIDRPFQIGDWVVIGEQEGTVEEIGFRSTRVRTFYNSLITIPNATLVNAAVDNLGARRYRRVKCMISLAYDTPAERIEGFCEGVRELIRLHPYTRKDYYLVYLNELGESSLKVLLYVFHETPDWATELRERHRLFVDIVRLAQRLGVEFAFPTRTLHLASAPAGMGGMAGAPDLDGATAPGAGGAAVAADLQDAGGHEKAIRLGRREADAIVREMWADTPQPPVDFRDPERIRPAAREEKKE